MTKLLDAYSGDKARQYELRRAKNPKWQFEQDALSNILAGLDGQVTTVLDVPVGTGRFLKTYRTKIRKARVHCLDYSDDMLRVASKKTGFFSKKRYRFQKHDIISSPPQVAADLSVCFRFLNLVDWQNASRAIQNILSATHTYAVFSIRLVDGGYDGERCIDNKIFLHTADDFAGLLHAGGFAVCESFSYTDDRPGTYGVFLCKRSGRHIECRKAKSNRIVYTAYSGGRPQHKTYQAFNDTHAQFIACVTRHPHVAKFFPEIHGLQGGFVKAAWVEGGECTPAQRAKIPEILFALHRLDIQQDACFDYVEDLVIPRFYSLHPVAGSRLCETVIGRIRNGASHYSARVSHPDLSPHNLVSTPGGPVVIDNELLCKTKHHRIDILNMLWNSEAEMHGAILESFLAFEKCTEADFADEYEYLNALWAARQSGAYLVRGNMDSALKIIDAYENTGTVVPFSLHG